MTSRLLMASLLALLVNAIFGEASLAQSVIVTVKLDAAQINVGESTTLHVYAQVPSTLRTNADRIFSWNVDVLNSSGTVADATGSITKPSADKDPQTSSNGVLDGANRRSVYDTFLNLPGAGVSAPVELFSVPVKGVAQGTAKLSVQAGTGAVGLGADFIVAPIGGGDPLLGADYSQANVTVQVGGSVCQSRLTPSLSTLVDGTRQMLIRFSLCPGQNHTVEFTDDLANPNWQPLPAAPQNSGSVTDSANAVHRFYRVRTGG